VTFSLSACSQSVQRLHCPDIPRFALSIAHKSAPVERSAGRGCHREAVARIIAGTCVKMDRAPDGARGECATKCRLHARASTSTLSSPPRIAYPKSPQSGGRRRSADVRVGGPLFQSTPARGGRPADLRRARHRTAEAPRPGGAPRCLELRPSQNPGEPHIPIPEYNVPSGTTGASARFLSGHYSKDCKSRC
jgi:hypothetical protein